MITENKLKHSLQVAILCMELAESLGLDKEKVDACFVMGFVHDIGYQDCLNTVDHPNTGKSMIDAFIKYSKECTSAIGHHGRIFENLSIFDVVLNYADLSVNSLGDRVSHDERLDDIKQRYGVDSEQYFNAQKELKCVIDAIKRYKTD